MGEPVKIVVVAQTEQAAADLKDFAAKSGADLSASLKQASKHGGELTGILGQNRLAMMELGHVGRATGEMLAMGVNPMRILALESPRILQAATTMGLGLSTIVPILGGVAAAAMLGQLVWDNYQDSLGQTEAKSKALAATLEKIPKLLADIATAQKAGALTPGQAQKFEDYLTGAKPLYRGAGRFAAQELTEDPYFRNIRTGAIQGKRDPASKEDVAAFVSTKQDEAKVSNAGTLDPRIAAGKELLDLEHKISEAGLTGTEKEKAAIVDRFAKEREQLEALMKERQEMLTPAERAGALDVLAKSHRDEQAALAEIDQKAALASAQKQNQEVLRAEADKNKLVQQQDQQLNTALENFAAQTADKTTAYWDEVYRAKYASAKDELDRELITQEQFDKKVADATKENIAGYKAANAELERRGQLEQEIARGKIQAQLAGVQGNPLLTDQQKVDQSLPLQKELLLQNELRIAKLQSDEAATTDASARLLAEQQITQLLTEQAGLKNQISAEENPWATKFTELRSQAEITATSLAATFGNVYNSAISSISGGITGLIMGTKTWSQFLMQIPQQIMTEIVGSIVQMGVHWIAQHTMMAAISTMFHVGDAAKHIATEGIKTGATIAGTATRTGVAVGSAITEISANAAVAGAGAASSQASIPYVGPILAVIAMGAIFAAVMSMASKFAQGGLVTGPGTGTSDSIPAMLSNGEFVVPQHAVSRLGVGYLNQLISGDIRHNGGDGDAPLAMGGGGSTKVVNVFDRSAFMEELKKADYANVIVNHVMANKTRLGIQT